MTREKICRAYSDALSSRFPGIHVDLNCLAEADTIEVFCIPDNQVREFMTFVLDELPDALGDLPGLPVIPHSTTNTKRYFPDVYASLTGVREAELPAAPSDRVVRMIDFDASESVSVPTKVPVIEALEG